MKRLRKMKSEKGQAIVEFAMVFPLFILLVMGIIDFGWLFYNYIGVTNAARNAARIACVEFDECCYDKEARAPLTNRVFGATIDGLDLEKINNDNVNAGAGKKYSDEEVYIAKIVDESLPNSVKDPTFTVKYSYDTSFTGSYNVWDRYEKGGNVTVTVTGKIHVLTPILGVFSDGMERDLTAKSTYKVEMQYEGDD